MIIISDTDHYIQFFSYNAQKKSHLDFVVNLRISHFRPKDFGMLFIRTIGVPPTADSMLGITPATSSLKPKMIWYQSRISKTFFIYIKNQQNFFIYS
jgi:hypothetical protein